MLYIWLHESDDDDTLDLRAERDVRPPSSQASNGRAARRQRRPPAI